MGETPNAKLRLYVEADLGPGAALALGPEQSHYVATVMRRKPGDSVLLFNGRDGEWRAEIAEASRKNCRLVVREKTRGQTADSDVRLLFAPIKRTRLDYTVQKATELGVSAIQPVFTDFTSVDRVNLDRLEANAIEAAEQCRRLTVPEILPPAKSLDTAVETLPPSRRLLVFDNDESAEPAAKVLAAFPRVGASYAILIGPEGGFSPRERDVFKSVSNSRFLTLGPRILRADTAVVSALTLWQATLGDWA